MYELLISIGLVLFFSVCLYRREWGIYLIILLLPSYQIRFHVFNIPATFLEGMILLLAAAQFITVIRNPRILSKLSPSLNPSHQGREINTNSSPLVGEARWGIAQYILISLFLLAAGIAVFTAPDTTRAAGIFKAYFFEAVLFYFLVRLIIDSREKLEKLFQSLALLVLYISVFGLYQFVTLYHLPHSWWAVDVSSRRIISLLNHPNAVALLLGPILAMLIFLPKNKLRWTAIVLGLAAFYLTFSRAGWLALVATLALGGLFTDYKKKILLGVTFLCIIIFIIPYSREKILELSSPQDASRQNRIVLWSAAADLVKKHPVTGVGLMGFREAYKNYPLGPDRVVQNYPHNFFLNFWLEAGLLGLLSMLGLLALFTKKIRNLLRTAEFKNYALAFAAAMTMTVLHSLVDVSYFKNDLAVLFWLIYALPNLGFRFD